MAPDRPQSPYRTSIGVAPRTTLWSGVDFQFHPFLTKRVCGPGSVLRYVQLVLPMGNCTYVRCVCAEALWRAMSITGHGTNSLLMSEPDAVTFGACELHEPKPLSPTRCLCSEPVLS